jgi:uridine phosphorylase
MNRDDFPILAHKAHAAPSEFQPENLLREARRQKGLGAQNIPPIGVLDPDGDIVRYLRATGRARRSQDWARYHSELYEFFIGAERFGIVGCAVGAPYAVLIAEQMFTSGCRFLVSVTSAGQIRWQAPPPYFILIDRALRDEGTSYHYLPPAEFAAADPRLVAAAMAHASEGLTPIIQGATWTTDAPFRETAAAIAAAEARGALAVEMEASALYAFAQARSRPVLCFAHVTNQMARIEGDFEKGEAAGASASLAVIAVATKAWRGYADSNLTER